MEGRKRRVWSNTKEFFLGKVGRCEVVLESEGDKVKRRRVKLVKKEIPEKIVRRYRGKLGREDIEYLMKVGVIEGRWDEVEVRILDAFARVWMLNSFVKRLLVRRPYRERVMLVETAAYGKLGSMIYGILKRQVNEVGRVDVEGVVREVCEKMNMDGEGFKRYVREMAKRMVKYVYMIMSKNLKGK
ncbi:MAG: hypothetical protein QXX12_03550 [Nanopusillaceae archaeon]